MRVNADFSQRVVVKYAETEWGPSPLPGVSRKMLDRIGGEVARATSLVRYEPGSAFSPHTHDGGEEYLVLEGVFQDEHGDFPVGSYVRNPPTSRHTPSAPDGAVILVKLHQFDPNDRQQVHIKTTDIDAPKVSLFIDAREDVRIETWGPGETIPLKAQDGLEIFVLEGDITEGDTKLTRWDWLRLPVGYESQAKVGPEGAKLWIKSGHLRHIMAPN